MDDYLVKSIKNFPVKKDLARTKEQVHFFIKFDGNKYPISFFDENILEVETSIVPNLRGLVDIYKLDKFFAQGLLVMVESNEYVTKYEYKRYTPSKTTQPSDYVFQGICKGWEDLNCTLLEKNNQKVYVNGEFFSKKEASISVFDRGFLFSDAVYEVSAVIGGKLVDWQEHFARLTRSLDHLNLVNNFQEKDFYQIQKKLIKENELKEGLCYIQVTRGIAERDFNFAKNSLVPTVVVFTQEKLILSNLAGKTGIKIITLPDDRWRRRDIKTTQLLAQSLAKTHAVHKGVDDCLLVQGGFINEGSSSNAFIIKDKRIITPSLSNDILGGITRASVIKFCKKNDIEIKVKKISIDDLKEAQEVFLTSSTGFVLPVIEIDGRHVGNGLVGDMVKEIQQIYLEQIQAKLS